MVHLFLKVSLALLLAAALATWFWPPLGWVFLVLGPLFLLGLHDALQTRQSVKRNFPVVGHLRYLLEAIRPEIAQYFIESNTDGTPFHREQRSIVYQRAKRALETLPFGTQHDLYAVGAEWINHSLEARVLEDREQRVRIGAPGTARPYEAALLNVSAMSFGSLSSHAIEALSRGAKAGGFYHNTGEGGLSPHHLAGGADVVWQIGTGYFGCRTPGGEFDEECFRRGASHEEVKMIEVKLSQGAKPGHGGILPAAKITPEIAEIRGVPLGRDVISPPAHSAFSGPRGLLEFVARLRALTGGKPVGFKLCVGHRAEMLSIVRAMHETGHRAEMLSIVRAMHETGILPDFVTVDGAEGGTGAAPLEFSNSVGWPLTEGLTFVHNALVGFGLRGDVKVIAAGKVISAFDMAKRLALGADLLNSARGMMFSLGCIQARRCHSNDCPVGVATQNPRLVRGLVIEDKWRRVQAFQEGTVHAFLELLGAAGLASAEELAPRHLRRRVTSARIESYETLYDWLEPEELLTAPPEPWARLLEETDTERFAPRGAPS